MNAATDRTSPGEAASLLSIVVPAYNEEQNIVALYRAVRSALGETELFEVIFVDDGSSDGTAAKVRQLRVDGFPVRLIRFGRNFGHQAALMAGLQWARGAAVITLDCDLQHPPALLPRMIAAWRQGAMVVRTVRIDTVGAGFFKKRSSSLFYWFLNLISKTPVMRGAADYQLLDRAVVDAVLEFKDRNPFLRGLVGWLGFSSTCLEYLAPARSAGSSGYSLRKRLTLAVDAITGLSSQPLRLTFYFGLLTAVLSVVYAIFALVALFAGRTVPGWTSVIMIVALLGSIQLVSLGVIGEYIARIYEQSRGIPRFVIVEADPVLERDGVPAGIHSQVSRLPRAASVPDRR